MTFFKKLMAAGVLLSLTLPIVVHGEENQTYSKPITDKNKQEVGTFSCEGDTEEWTKEVVLKASVLSNNGTLLSDVTYTWEKSGKYSEGSVLTVKENGTYKASAEWPAASGLTTEAIEIPVENIDTTAPEIVNIIQSSESWTKGSLTLTFECEDYQPLEVSETTPETDDGSGDTSSGEESREKGSGLHPEGAYSFDNGQTWVKENSITVDKNGSVEFAVRDSLENVTRKTVTVDCIDKKEPTVRLSIADGGVLYEGEAGSVIITAVASDGESGLSENAYSWDGGMSWNNSNTLKVTQAGNYTVYVRDQAGNFVAGSLKIDYAQRPSGNDGVSDGSQTGNGSSGSNGSGGSSSDNNILTSGGSDSSSAVNNNSSGIIYYGNTDTPVVPAESRQETDGESRESETEAPEKKTETKETVDEEKESSGKVIGADSGKTTGGTGRWVFVAIGAALILAGGIIVARVLSNRSTASAIGDDRDDIDNMENVYERVSAEERKVTEGTVSAVVDETAQVTEAEVLKDTTELNVEEAMGAAVAAVMTEEDDEETEVSESESMEKTIEIPVIETETEVSENLAEEMETEVSENPAEEIETEVFENPTEEAETEEIPVIEEGLQSDPVVLEGEHSRLIYDPETGEYKYELK